jgi:L-amino acid N-acyltransferase YncA
MRIREATAADRGFEEVGTMREVGRKLDRWIDLMWLQRRLGSSDG